MNTGMLSFSLKPVLIPNYGNWTITEVLSYTVY